MSKVSRHSTLPCLKLDYNGCKASARRRQAGFTMIELVTVIALVAVLSLVLGRLLLSGVDAFNYATNRKQALRQARIALSTLSRELRQIRDSNSITQAEQQTISFVNIDDEQVTIEYSNGRVLRNSVPVARNVTQFELQYYDQSGQLLSFPIANRSEIRAIRIVLQVTVGGKSIRLETEVRPRNL